MSRLPRKSSSLPQPATDNGEDPVRGPRVHRGREVWEVWNPDAVGRLVRTSALSVGGLITPIGLLIVTLMTVGR